MKLEMKHLAPYLPYDLKCQSNIAFDYETILELGSINVNDEATFSNREKAIGIWTFADFKPILRPLSDLIKEDFKEEILRYYENLGIDIKLVNYDSGNDNPFDITLTATSKLMDDVFTDILINRGSTSETPYHFFNWLCKNHFDVFNLIPEGLAIDINTL